MEITNQAKVNAAIDEIKKDPKNERVVSAAINSIKAEMQQLQSDGKPDKAADLGRDFSLKLVECKIGHAADIMADAADIYQAQGDINAAADAFKRLAKALFKKGMYGWAGSRFYYAAAVYIANGELQKTLEILQYARDKFQGRSDEPWVNWLPRHTKLLADKTQSDTKKLAKLQLDFEQSSRDSWARSCIQGSEKLQRATP